MPGSLGAITTTLARAAGRQAVSVLTALSLVAGITVALALLSRMIDVREVSVVYLIPVLIAATQWGVVPAVIAAIAGVGVSAYFFYPPIFSLQVRNPQQVAELSLFIFVAVVTSQLANSVKRQAEIARQREDETRELYAFTRRLATTHDPNDIYVAIRDHLSAAIQGRMALLGIGSDHKTGDTLDIPGPVAREADRLTSNPGDGGAGSIVNDGSGNLWLVRSVSPKTRAFGVVAIDLGSRSQDAAGEARNRVDAILAEATATLERLDLANAIAEAKMRSQTEVLREALIGSVSHELRTPLASILGAATIVGEAQSVKNDKRLTELTNVIRSEADRLNGDIQNLLDATRISSLGVRPKQGWADPADIVNAAIERRRLRLAGHKIVLAVDRDLPLVYVDVVLLEQAFGQILDNAAKYSPAGSQITVRAEGEDNAVKMSVTDQGYGLSSEESAHLWERFFRGERHAATVSGSGLGLWIAHAFITANSGQLEAASDGPGRGSTFSITLPVPQNAQEDLVDSDE